MKADFHDRFNIKVGIDEAKARFVNRVNSLIFEKLLNDIDYSVRPEFIREVVAHIGEPYRSGEPIKNFTQSDFHQTLHAIEGLYEALSTKEDYQEETQYLLALIDDCVKRAEVSLEIGWENDQFLPKGAKILDDKLVNDVLGWLRRQGYENVHHHYEKGLKHFLETEPSKSPVGAINDMYVAMEAMAKIVTGRHDKDLSANCELFISKVKASDEYKVLLKDYIDYANKLIRHASSPGEKIPDPDRKEVESFIYLTGLFLRLAMPQ
jgi:hypothetical protein